MSDAYLQTKVRRDTPACPWEHSGVCETNGAETAFFIPFPSVCAPLTHTTQRGTHVMHHAVISDSEVEVITSGRPLPFLPSLHTPNSAARRSYVSHRSGGWRQLISSPWHAMMERRALNPSTYSRPRAPARPRRGGGVSDAWRVYWSATGGRPERRWRHSLHFSWCSHSSLSPRLRSWHTHCDFTVDLRRDVSFRFTLTFIVW